MTYEIIKNAPPPKNARSKYPFGKMEVGDAFDAPRDMGTGFGGVCKRQSSISNSARQWVKKKITRQQNSLSINLMKKQYAVGGSRDPVRTNHSPP